MKNEEKYEIEFNRHIYRLKENFIIKTCFNTTCDQCKYYKRGCTHKDHPSGQVLTAVEKNTIADVSE